MKKKLVTIGLVVTVIIGLAVFGSSGSSLVKEKVVFHVTLANPQLYNDGKYTKSFEINQGQYFFRFVPNGDSPKTLTISLIGDDFNYLEKFELIGTLHNTGISEYYTWDYDGQKIITISKNQEIEISINPNGNLMGPVSVDLVLEKEMA